MTDGGGNCRVTHWPRQQPLGHGTVIGYQPQGDSEFQPWGFPGGSSPVTGMRVRPLRAGISQSLWSFRSLGRQADDEADVDHLDNTGS